MIGSRGFPRLTPYDFAGRTAVLTGAASGMGEQLAYQLAAHGVGRLVVLDRNAEQLEGVVGTVRRRHPGCQVDVHVVDLADLEQLHATADRILADVTTVDLLLNNAGVALGGRFEEMTLEEFDWVLAVNFRAPVTLTHRLLPALFASPGAHVVSVSSLFGLVAPPGQTAYSASKFGLRGWSEALRAELAPRGIGVTTVHPGGIRTAIARNARIASGTPADEAAAGIAQFDTLLTYPADRAATDILEAVRRRRPRLLIGLSAKLPDVVARVVPGRYNDLLAWLTPAAAAKPAAAKASSSQALPRQ